MQQVTFTEPQLCHYDLNIKKSWFVFFDITNTLTGETKRKQFRGGINYWPKAAERLREGNALLSFWKEELKSGRYNPFKKPGETSTLMAPESLKHSIELIIDLKASSLKRRSVGKYKEVTGMFITWCSRYNYDKIRTNQFTQEMAMAYLDYLSLEKKYSGKSSNGHLNVLKALFSAIKTRWKSSLPENPFTGIKPLPEQAGNNIAYTPAERSAIIDYLRVYEKRMYYAVNFLFHAYIRKTELTTLRVQDIDWENKTIKINAEATKNRLQDSVTITEGLMKVLYEMGLDMAPPHYYIFGDLMQTSAKQISKPDFISDRYLEIKKQLGYTAGDGKTFYAWKHTGVVCYWKEVKDIYYMMRQLRHHDMKTTMVYLRSLGLMPNMAFQEAKVFI